MQNFELRLHCDEIKNLQDKMMIESALSHSPGIDTVDVDIERHELRVVTANQDGGADVLRCLDNAGFTCDRMKP